VIPSLPKDLIRNLAQQFSSKPLSKEVLPTLERATDEFFKNIRSPSPHPLSEPKLMLVFSSDLGTFASHAGRKVIEEGDVQMLLQRYISPCFSAG
jgi:histone H3/H4